MRAETLFEVIQDIRLDFEETGIRGLLIKLTRAVGEQVNRSDDETQRAVSAARQALRRAVSASRFNRYPIAKSAILKRIKVEQFVGVNLLREVDDVFSGNEITPAVVYTQLDEIVQTIDDICTEAEKFVSGATYFYVSEDRLPPGAFEITVAIPCRAVDSELAQFGKETLNINRMLAVFSEIATGSRDPLKIRAISSSDLTVLLDSAPAVAALVATAIERVATLYERVLTIIKMRRDMKAHGIPEDIVAALKNHIDKTVGAGLDEVGSEIKKDYFAQIEEFRRPELDMELRKSLHDLARRLDGGYTFDVRGEPLADTPDREADATQSAKVISAALRRVEEARPRLQSFEAEAQPILRLGDRDADEGESQTD